MTKRIFAAVLLLCLFVSVVYAQSAATVFGWPPADGSVTNAKLAEPVSVANGGTGKTTAAEALAALGGASLNGSSTVSFAANNAYIAGRVGVATTTPQNLFHVVSTSLSLVRAGRIETNQAGHSVYQTFGNTADNTTVYLGIDGDGFWGVQNGAAVFGAGTPGKDTAFLAGGVVVARLKSGGVVNFPSIPAYADNAAAVSGGLVTGDLYHTAGVVKVVIP